MRLAVGVTASTGLGAGDVDKAAVDADTTAVPRAEDDKRDEAADRAGNDVVDYPFPVSLLLPPACAFDLCVAKAGDSGGSWAACRGRSRQAGSWV
jgi:hypothetical protein